MQFTKMNIVQLQKKTHCSAFRMSLLRNPLSTAKMTINAMLRHIKK